MVASRHTFHPDLKFSLSELGDLAPTSSELIYQEGLELFELGAEKNCTKMLWRAAALFKQVDQWHASALALGLIYGFNGSKEALDEAKIMIDKAPPSAEVHWDAALIYLKLAEKSGEIDDLMKAIDRFEKSSSLMEPTYFEFWNELGRAYDLLSHLLDDMRPIVKSIACYKKGIGTSLTNTDGWLGLGRALKRLYKLTQENDHYVQAHDCFVAATQLNPGSVDVWIERIAFTVESGIESKDNAKLRSVIEKCENASYSLGTHRTIKAYWAIALAFIGKRTGRVDLFQEAGEKIGPILDDEDLDDPMLIRLCGIYLYALAGYHEDIDLYYQAIEQFQQSIAIDRTQADSWKWMGHTYAKVFDISDDMGAVEKALYFYSKSLQIKNDPHLYFDIATLLIHMGDSSRHAEPIEQAITYLEYLLTSYKSIAYDNPEWFFQYGLAQNLLGDLKDDRALLHKALEAYINVLMLAPTHPSIHHRLGIVYSHLGETYQDTDYLYRSLHHFKLASKTLEENEHLLIDWGLSLVGLSCISQDTTNLREAENKFLEAARLGSQTVFFHLACLYSLQESYEKSIFYLQKSYRTKNLPPIDEIMEDEWLDNVRATSQFQEFLALLNQK